MNVKIVAAADRHIDEINALIARSKAHWDWPSGYLEKALPLHVITPEYLKRNPSFEALHFESGGVVAFFSIEQRDPRPVLENLWVCPERMGQGIGRIACTYVFDLATKHGWTEIDVLPDPPAEAFYLRMGFYDTGTRVPSRISGGPLFSVFRWSMI